MDYSASIHDADHPAGASPWETSPISSPDAHGSTFGALASDPPTSPSRFESPIPRNGFGAGQDEGGFGPEDHSWPDTSTMVSASDRPTQTPGLGGDGSAEQQQRGGACGDENISPSQAQDHNRLSGDTARASQEQPQMRKLAQPSYRLQAKITGLERAARKDPILRFDVHTNFPRFRTTQFRDVRRLHSEFVKLAEYLISANPEAIVPAVPPPLTSAGAGTDEDENRVKALMQRWFNYVCSNGVLARDDEMVLFVESDFGYSPMVKKKQPATGVRRKLLKQFSPPPDDTPELAEARPIVKLFYLGSMDAGHKVDRLVKSRRGLGLTQSEFGVRLGSMNVQEPHQGLANAYRKLGKIIQTVGDSQQAQATTEAFAIGDPLQYHSSDAFIVKETLTNRQLLIRDFLQAQENTRNRLNATDRLKASSNVRREKVDEALTALDEAKRNEVDLHQKTQRVTQNLVQERRKWFARTAADLRASIREFVCKEIEAERRTLAMLETVRPDIRAIDATGGLSRLGRESHPAVRRTSLASSQGPKGDAWSGVPRRSADLMGRSVSGTFMSSVVEEAAGEEETASVPASGLPDLNGEDDEDRVDARNAASRLATSTF